VILTSWWSRTTADLPRPFWHLMAATFVNRIGYVVEPFLALYLAGPRQLTPTTIGVVLACFGAGSFVSQILGGYLAPFAPGGLGVREAVFQATLVLIVHEQAAIAVITMRLIQTLVEVLMAAAGALLMRRAAEPAAGSDLTNVV